jgi:hypothetical protein
LCADGGLTSYQRVFASWLHFLRFRRDERIWQDRATESTGRLQRTQVARIWENEHFLPPDLPFATLGSSSPSLRPAYRF